MDNFIITEKKVMISGDIKETEEYVGNSIYKVAIKEEKRYLFTLFFIF